eukprot:Sdes_comp8913_c0_seq2m322
MKPGPFFPGGYHEFGTPSGLYLGVENSDLLVDAFLQAFQEHQKLEENPNESSKYSGNIILLAKKHLFSHMEGLYSRIDQLAQTFCADENIQYYGIDCSIVPQVGP